MVRLYPIRPDLASGLPFCERECLEVLPQVRGLWGWDPGSMYARRCPDGLWGCGVKNSFAIFDRIVDVGVTAVFK